MTQYNQPPVAPPPPPGYGAPPPPGAYGGYPPGGGQPRKTNGPAIASLICGVLSFCIPFLAGLLAIILGFFGIRSARDPQTGGKGLAVAGLILGVLGLGMWTLFGGAIYALIQGTAPQREVARQVVTDLAAGNVDAAAANTDPATLPREQLQSISDQLKGLGALTDTTAVGVNATPGRTEVVIVAAFGQTPKQFQVGVQKGADGKYKVVSLATQN